MLGRWDEPFDGVFKSDKIRVVRWSDAGTRLLIWRN